VQKHIPLKVLLLSCVVFNDMAMAMFKFNPEETAETEPLYNYCYITSDAVEQYAADQAGQMPSHTIDTEPAQVDHDAELSLNPPQPKITQASSASATPLCTFNFNNVDLLILQKYPADSIQTLRKMCNIVAPIMRSYYDKEEDLDDLNFDTIGIYNDAIHLLTGKFLFITYDCIGSKVNCFAQINGQETPTPWFLNTITQVFLTWIRKIFVANKIKPQDKVELSTLVTDRHIQQFLTNILILIENTQAAPLKTDSTIERFGKEYLETLKKERDTPPTPVSALAKTATAERTIVAQATTPSSFQERRLSHTAQDFFQAVAPLTLTEQTSHAETTVILNLDLPDDNVTSCFTDILVHLNKVCLLYCAKIHELLDHSKATNLSFTLNDVITRHHKPLYDDFFNELFLGIGGDIGTYTELVNDTLQPKKEVSLTIHYSFLSFLGKLYDVNKVRMITSDALQKMVTDQELSLYLINLYPLLKITINSPGNWKDYVSSFADQYETYFKGKYPPVSPSSAKTAASSVKAPPVSAECSAGEKRRRHSQTYDVVKLTRTVLQRLSGSLIPTMSDLHADRFTQFGVQPHSSVKCTTV
jgi:hypothetical protein